MQGWYYRTKLLRETSGLSGTGLEQEVWTSLSIPLPNPRVESQRSSALIAVTKTQSKEIGYSERMAIQLTTNALSVS